MLLQFPKLLLQLGDLLLQLLDQLRSVTRRATLNAITFQRASRTQEAAGEFNAAIRLRGLRIGFGRSAGLDGQNRPTLDADVDHAHSLTESLSAYRHAEAIIKRAAFYQGSLVRSDQSGAWRHGTPRGCSQIIHIAEPAVSELSNSITV
ncbi:hypothetical protein D3C77_531630 [compost metagenome]